MAQTVSSPSTKTFHVASPMITLLPAALVCVAAFVIIPMLVPTRDALFLPVLAAALAAIFLLMVWMVGQIRLEVSPDGLVFHSLGYRVRSSWDNLAGVGKRRMRSQTYEALILRQPTIEMVGWIGASYRLMPAVAAASPDGGKTSVPFALAKYQEFIPVALFARDWRRSELGELIRRYAPQAFNHPV
jgi:hypothetical protein